MPKIYNPRISDNSAYNLALHETAFGSVSLDIVDTRGVTRYSIARIEQNGTLTLCRNMSDKTVTNLAGIKVNEEGRIVCEKISPDDTKQHQPFILKPYSPDDKEGYSIGLRRDCEDIDIIIIDNATGEAEEVIASISEDDGLNLFDLRGRNSIYNFPLTSEGFIKEIE